MYAYLHTNGNHMVGPTKQKICFDSDVAYKQLDLFSSNKPIEEDYRRQEKNRYRIHSPNNMEKRNSMILKYIVYMYMC